MKRSIHLLSHLAVVLGIGACATDPDPVAPVVDMTGPAVVAVSPADGASEIAVNAPVVVTFSEPIDPASVDPNWVHLTVAHYLLPVSLTVEHGDELRIFLPAGLGSHAAYKLTVTGIADLDGNPMTPFASRFTTAAASAQVSDPTGDTFGSGTFLPDLILASASTQDAVTITLQFDQPIAPYLDGAPNSIAGYIDIDIDQDAATGGAALTDSFRSAPGSTGLGDEFVISLFQNSDGTMQINGQNGGGSVTPTFTSTSVSLTIPLAMLGNDDGNLNLAAVVGSMNEPTDIIPNDGHLTLGTSGQPGCTSIAKRASSTSVLQSPRGWGNAF